ncbi:hypothetical protein CEW87_04105 [Parazoarcus communis]|uniref:HTH araC/xylS-type domain-containing protein n=1 Tax=Parazoarcus communis TaxID=41977 RepID=A0A2U8H0B6_9RHOO|nr:hypothetical protein [Parazoarcus communis]AWI78616.1 hypothetical protein CEW87_04105 [Parazoarcus communis]
MPSFNFKPQFCAAIRSGHKRQTIRARGKRPAPAVGQIAHLYAGLGTLAVSHLGEHPITSVEDIQISTRNNTVRMVRGNAWYDLEEDAVEQLANDDGFNSAAEFFAFFKDEFGPTFSGYLIKW